MKRIPWSRPCRSFALVLASTACASDDSASASATGSGSASTEAVASGSSGLADDTGGTSDASTGSDFLANPDLGEGSECDYFVQDCAPGLKCMPWASDGGTWNASHCTPIAEDPAGVDEPCRVEISGVSGRDDCDLGLYCWDVEPKTNEGRCIPLCLGSEATAYCSDPGRACWVSADASISICFPVCDPLAQDCIEGQGCYLDSGYGSWVCAEDASGDTGAYGDPCDSIAACDPGLACVDASTVPPGLPCESASGCCTELCDLDDPAGDAQCSGAAAGSTCVPWYDEDEAPPQLEHVGVCALPA